MGLGTQPVDFLDGLGRGIYRNVGLQAVDALGPRRDRAVVTKVRLLGDVKGRSQAFQLRDGSVAHDLSNDTEDDLRIWQDHLLAFHVQSVTERGDGKARPVGSLSLKGQQLVTPQPVSSSARSKEYGPCL